MTPSLHAGLARLRAGFRLRLRDEADTLAALGRDLPDAAAAADIRRIVHRIVGGAAVFGCPQLEEPAAKVEDLAVVAPAELLEPLSALIAMMREAGEPEIEEPAYGRRIGEAS